MKPSANKLFAITILGAAVMLGSTAAEAHVGHGSTMGFAHGFVHPFSGIDHILAMVAVGLFAARLGGRALWLVPSAFVAMMTVGGIMGIFGIGVPYVEVGIAASVLVLGSLMAFELALPPSFAMGLVGFFAVFHGHAHGAEMPATTSGFTYAVGFMCATAALHIIGIGLGVFSGQMAQMQYRSWVRVAGGMMAITGLGLLAGAF